MMMNFNNQEKEYSYERPYIKKKEMLACTYYRV